MLLSGVASCRHSDHSDHAVMHSTSYLLGPLSKPKPSTFNLLAIPTLMFGGIPREEIGLEMTVTNLSPALFMLELGPMHLIALLCGRNDLCNLARVVQAQLSIVEGQSELLCHLTGMEVDEGIATIQLALEVLGKVEDGLGFRV